MRYSQASIAQCGRIAELVRDTITTVYPKYYPSEIVDFFCDLHNQRAIEADIKAGNVWVLSDGEQIVGTGSRDKNHITRVYVEPQFQGNGYGSHIMRKLEDEISRDYDTIYLDASLPATLLYETLGYRTIRHDRHIVDNGVVLVYAIMEKKSPFGQVGASDMKCTEPVFAVKDMQAERAFYKNLFWFESYQVNGFKHRIRRWAVATTEVLLVDGDNEQ